MENRDERLWKIAKKRAAFKKQLGTYLIVNGFLWILWLFTEGTHNFSGWHLPWPVWPSLGWGIGLAFSYFGAYHDDREGMAEREYEKLKNKGL